MRCDAYDQSTYNTSSQLQQYSETFTLFVWKIVCILIVLINYLNNRAKKYNFLYLRKCFHFIVNTISKVDVLEWSDEIKNVVFPQSFILPYPLLTDYTLVICGKHLNKIKLCGRTSTHFTISNAPFTPRPYNLRE